MNHRPNPTRREFLQTSGVAGAAMVLAPGAAVAASAETVPQVPQRVLGKTGQRVPILLMGGAMRFDQRFDPRLAECMRYGVTYIDTADCYSGGNSEPAVGNFVERTKARDKIWITTKSDEHDPAGLEQVLGRSLQRLKTPYVEQLFLHALQDPSMLNAELGKKVETLKKSGKIKYFGFSCHHGNVAELLRLAAANSYIDAVMFRYNFQEYGDAALNSAMDAAAKANVGLIAMKTQGSEASFAPKWEKIQKANKWTKHQAVLKAVWADPRISAAVSHMDSLEKIRQNVAAAVDKTELGALERDDLVRYAAAARPYYCSGCDHLCNPAVDAPVRIGDTMRSLMYHDAYGDPHRAREAFRELPTEAKQLDGVDFSRASAACPHGVDVGMHMRRAQRVLA
jgi:predicted aldo/keto reductase-like oxidoreductase